MHRGRPNRGRRSSSWTSPSVARRAAPVKRPGGPTMNVVDAPLASTRTPIDVPTAAREKGTAAGQLAGASLFVSDMEHVAHDARVAFLVADHAWELVVARVFGVAPQSQSVLVKMILTGALATVAGSYVPRPSLTRPSRTGTAMGASVLNAAARGLVGAPSRTFPAAGAL